jgi:lipooligosaccharide transport system permease protein
LLFLTAMGLGLGGYVDSSGQAVLGGVPYLAFLAPGLLVATAMQAGSFESTFPIMGGLVWNRTFHAMYATPLTSRDVALGNLLWVAARLTLITTVFTAVIVAFGAALSPMVVLAIPVAVLTGLAFSAPIAAFSATQRTPDRFAAIFRFLITPLFIFSGTFFPVEGLPAVVQPLAWLTPLYHGGVLARGLSLGTFGTNPTPERALIHLAVLIGFIVVGTFLAIRTFNAKLVRG